MTDRCRGAIISFGKCAATIQDNTQQYYASYRELNRDVMNSLLVQSPTKKMEPVLVTFGVDTSRHSGISYNSPRYFATDVRLRDVIYL